MTALLPAHLQKLPYRPCVGIILLNDEGKVFVGERIDTPGAWQMPQGGIDPNEEVIPAALRELREETGIDKVSIKQILKDKIAYDLPESRIPNFWNAAYRGQEQTWIAMRFEGQDKDINLNLHHEPEFSQWKWVDPKETIDLIVPFKKELYKQVISQLIKQKII